VPVGLAGVSPQSPWYVLLGPGPRGEARPDRPRHSCGLTYDIGSSRTTIGGGEGSNMWLSVPASQMDYAGTPPRVSTRPARTFFSGVNDTQQRGELKRDASSA
jgi:hypothetical protein